jgi:hypothetical protein
MNNPVYINGIVFQVRYLLELELKRNFNFVLQDDSHMDDGEGS